MPITLTIYSYNDLVFINCPFDDQYQPLLRAIVFTIYKCGFYPESAMREDNGLENRIDKLFRIIERCKYGIHDISRIELDAHNHLPRFNMPFELGVFHGARRFGDERQKNKNALIFERVKYSYQQYLSDINGVDIKAHENNPQLVIRQVRNWLSNNSKRTTIPPATQIEHDFREFLDNLPISGGTIYIDDINEIPFNDYCELVERSIRAKFKRP